MTSTEPPVSAREKAVYAAFNAAVEMRKKGLTYQQIEQDLVERGIHKQTASSMIQKLKQGRKKEMRSAGFRNMGIGAVVFAVGLIVSIGSFLRAISSPTGGLYVIAFGLVILGAVAFLDGLSRLFWRDKD